jgi:hypothetical protein
MKAAFLLVLSANLLFLAWAQWIDSPRDAGEQDRLRRLPSLQLVDEIPPGRKPMAAAFPRTSPREPAAAVGIVKSAG